MPSDQPVLPPILLVEDDLGLTRLVQLVMERARIANPVIAVGTGNAALARLLTGHAMRPALVLLDLGLPDVDGVSLLGLIRDRFDAWTLPIVVMSGSVGESDVNRVMAAGANLFLRKPVPIDDLIAALERFGINAAFEEAT